jgi:hypothetical protein
VIYHETSTSFLHVSNEKGREENNSVAIITQKGIIDCGKNKNLLLNAKWNIIFYS